MAIYCLIFLKDIYELKTKENGERSVDRVTEHETDFYPVMNAAVVADGKNYSLAVGLDQFCQLYALKYRVVTPKKDGEGTISSNNTLMLIREFSFNTLIDNKDTW